MDQDIADLHQDIEELRPGKRGEGNSGKRPAFWEEEEVATPAVEIRKINLKWLEIRKSWDFAIFSFEPYSFQQSIGSGVTWFFLVTCK